MTKAAENQPSKAALRKKKQREREQKLGIKKFEMRLARGERKMIAENAATRGFEDQTEYLFSLVMADRKALERDGSQIQFIDNFEQ